MKRYRFMIIPIILVGLIIGFAVNRTAATRKILPKPPSYPFEEAAQIAQTKLPIFMDSATLNYTDYGFKNEQEPKRATLGVPYLNYGFDLEAMAAEDYRDGDFRSKLVGGIAIQFPVLVDNKVRTNIAVEYRDGVWQDGAWGGQPTLLVNVQRHLAAQGITERVDWLDFGLGWSVFGMIDYKGQTMLIPLQDWGNHFPTLDFKSDHMYTLDEILPLVHEQSKIAVAEMERQDQLMRTEIARITPQPSEAATIETDRRSVESAETPLPVPPATMTPTP